MSFLSVTAVRRSVPGFATLVAALLFLADVGPANASISYGTPDAEYAQNFNGLPTDTRTNQNIEVAAAGFENYADGWQDDVDATVSAQDDVSIPGWYLYHALTPGAPAGENGFNNHQRLRFGTGGDNAGAFYGFATGDATTTEKALGFLPSTTVSTNPQADPLSNNDDYMFIGLRLTNNTGITLNEFTLGYDGEQWRDGGRSGSQTSVKFEWKVDALNVHQIAGFTAVPELGFTSVVANGTTTGALVNGNTTGLVTVNDFTVESVNWAPGTDLWLRWGDQQQTGNDHGMAIDNISFTASEGELVELLAGDHNVDGTVDAADYPAWRKLDEGNEQGYTNFVKDFGRTIIPGSGGGGAVPEPSTIVMALALFGWIAAGRRRVACHFVG